MGFFDWFRKDKLDPELKELFDTVVARGDFVLENGRFYNNKLNIYFYSDNTVRMNGTEYKYNTQKAFINYNKQLLTMYKGEKKWH